MTVSADASANDHPRENQPGKSPSILFTCVAGPLPDRTRTVSGKPFRDAGFDAVRLDWDDASTPLLAPGGGSTPGAWARELGITRVPAFVFFDESGKEVFRVESLVLRQRTERGLMYVLEKAYDRGETYQEFTRKKTIEKMQAANENRLLPVAAE